MSKFAKCYKKLVLRESHDRQCLEGTWPKEDEEEDADADNDDYWE